MSIINVIDKSTNMITIKHSLRMLLLLDGAREVYEKREILRESLEHNLNRRSFHNSRSYILKLTKRPSPPLNQTLWSTHARFL